MASVKYQVIFNEKVDFKEEIISCLFEAQSQIYDRIERQELYNYISINYIKKVRDDIFIIGFNFNFDGDPVELVSYLNKCLSDHQNITHVFKFIDGLLYQELQKYSKNIFEIEMNLREIINLVFIANYQGDFYNLFKEFNINPQFPNKHLSKDLSEREEFLKEKFENELFYILFSDYDRLTKPKELKQEDLFLITELSNNFGEFKEKIMSRGITNESHLEFFNGIKEHLNNLEQIRNCVAHYRTPSNKEIENYEKSKPEIKDKIDEFLRVLKEESIKYLPILIDIRTEIRESTQLIEIASVTLIDSEGNETEYDGLDLGTQFGLYENWPEIKSVIEGFVVDSLKNKGFEKIDDSDIEIYDPSGEVS